jgi:hypothetical protein
MPSAGNRTLMCLHVLHMRAAACRTSAMHRSGGVYAAACSAFAMPRCGRRGFRVSCTFARFVTMGGPLGTERVGSDWNEQHQRAADCCHDKSIHKTVSDCEAKVTPGLPWRGIHIFSTAHFNNRLPDTGDSPAVAAKELQSRILDFVNAKNIIQRLNDV